MGQVTEVLLREVRRSAAVRPAMARVLSACARSVPEAPWRDLESLPFEADAERAESWLLASLEQTPPPPELDDLWIRVRPAHWRGRLDGCDLVLGPGPPTAEIDPVPDPGDWLPAEPAMGSAVLTRLLQLAGDAEPRVAELLAGELALGHAALAVQHCLGRIDRDLLLAGREDRGIWVGYAGGLCLFLGWRVGDRWDREGFGLDGKRLTSW